MRKFKAIVLLAAMAIGGYAPLSQADDYVSAVSGKLTRGFANLFTGLGEVPKNMINASAKTDPVVGGSGGLLRGTLDTLGRTGAGIVDVLSSPIPSKSLVQPEYVWTDFNQQTTYKLLDK